MSDHNIPIVFLGGGNMARAMISGLIKQGWPNTAITVIERDAATRQQLHSTWGLTCQPATHSHKPLAPSLWILAVKPQHMAAAIGQQTALHDARLIISVAAGITLNWLQRQWPNAKLVRAMPNTPALVGSGMSGLLANDKLTLTDRQVVEHIMGAIGHFLWFANEDDLDKVTAVSGSGPAYFFLLAETMIQAGIRLGLDAAASEQLVRQTLIGTAQMLANHQQISPGDFRRQVTSPGGTTEAALNFLQQQHFEHNICCALDAAYQRSQSLGKHD